MWRKLTILASGYFFISKKYSLSNGSTHFLMTLHLQVPNDNSNSIEHSMRSDSLGG
jgi:hypothetical protein